MPDFFGLPRSQLMHACHFCWLLNWFVVVNMVFTYNADVCNITLVLIIRYFFLTKQTTLICIVSCSTVMMHFTLCNYLFILRTKINPDMAIAYSLSAKLWADMKTSRVMQELVTVVKSVAHELSWLVNLTDYLSKGFSDYLSKGLEIIN